MALRAASQSGVLVASSQITGTTTNDNAASGRIGEFIESNVPGPGSAITSTIAADITSISLTAGDWDVFGSVAFATATATKTQFNGWINTVSATPPAGAGLGAYAFDNNATSVGESLVVPGLKRRVSIASTTTVYLSTQVTFTGGASTAYGYIAARRAR